jgi:Fe-S-cluster containining protein
LALNRKAADIRRLFALPGSMEMKEILGKYGEHLRKVDRWFAGCMEKQPDTIHCRTGCSECCRSIFDITLLDGFYLKSGFDLLDQATKASVLVKAKRCLKWLQGHWPDFDAPYILNYRPEEEWEPLMPEDDETPCPLLGNDGTCMVYDYRPMTCRLHGLPLVDISGEVLHDEWCTLNFTLKNPMEILELRWRFNELFREELLIFREFTKGLLNHPMNELDTFIATALLIDIRNFDWKGWLKKSGLSDLR